MKLFQYICLLFLILSCTYSVDNYTDVDRYAKIYPLYEGTYIPYNIAPLNFQLREAGSTFVVRVVAGNDSFEVKAEKNIKFPLKRWRNLLSENKGKQLLVKIFSINGESIVKYKDIDFRIANEPIDPYVAYRLIEPGYELWNEMGIYQRCLENFNETPIMLNTLTDNNCMNCHSFSNNNPETMLFHMRGSYGGTIILKHSDIKKIEMKTSWMPAAGVYPRWHPEERYIAFSTNKTNQVFRSAHPNRIEVFDTESDIVIYDSEKNVIFTDTLLFSKNSYETFPEWSPDGRYLYFCSAPALDMPKNYQSLKYDILRISFNPEKGTFGNKVDTLVSAKQTVKSSVIPRVSPDGNYLVFCMSNYGTFPIWHKENDLYQINLKTGETSLMKDINSDESDSYHSWSSNGRWIVFSSRRSGDSFTRLYVSYFDEKGKAYKAFILPQKDPDYYEMLFKSYNVPECIKGKVDLSPYDINEIARGPSNLVDNANKRDF